MEVNFKFELGDLVICKAHLEAYRLEVFECNARQLAEGKTFAPRLMTVTTRTMEQCPGGVQYNYVCRNWLPGYTAPGLVQFNEIELQKWDTEAFVDEYTDALARAQTSVDR